MRFVVVLSVFVLVLAACGGDGADSAVGSDDGGTEQSSDDGGEADPAPEPVSPAEMNTIRIGNEVWDRTLPMTTGQCFLPAEGGDDPVNGTVWGTLNGNDELSFSVDYQADGSHEAEVEDNAGLHWVAGARNSDVDDLEIELDFDAQTMSGSGTFTNFISGESAGGSFAFQCEGE